MSRRTASPRSVGAPSSAAPVSSAARCAGPRRTVAARRLRLRRRHVVRVRRRSTRADHRPRRALNWSGSSTTPAATSMAGTPQRLAVRLHRPAAAGPPTPTARPPSTFQLARDGTDVGAPVTLPRHTDGVPIGYYPLVTHLRSEPGTYDRRPPSSTGSPSTPGLPVSSRRAAPRIRQVGRDHACRSRRRPRPTPAASNPICTRSPAVPVPRPDPDRRRSPPGTPDGAAGLHARSSARSACAGRCSTC